VRTPVESALGLVFPEPTAAASIGALLRRETGGGNRARAHWRERMPADDPTPNADVGSNSEVVLVLPDNSRDPELTQVLQASD
jgi:hypothetical protein